MKCLIIIDMQNDFISGSLGSKEAESIVDVVANKIANYDGKVFYTMDTHGKDYLKSQEGRNLPVEHCVKGTSGWELNSKVGEALESKDATKYEKNGFSSVELACDLKKYDEKKGIDEIELCGLCTDFCVIVSAFLLKSYLPEVKIIVDSKACRGVTKEGHENALKAMKTCHVLVK